MAADELSPSVRNFISQHIRSIEQLEILLLMWREPETVWSIQKVYDAILSTPHSVKRWLEELAQSGLLDRLGEPGSDYRARVDPALSTRMAELAEFYRTKPVRVIEAVYKRREDAAQSFADAFKLRPPPPASS